MDKTLDLGLKLLTPLLAVAAFVWGIYTYREAQHQQAETRRIEATRPYLDKQLALYIEATQVTARIATSGDAAEVEKSLKRFRELYWGELALVEHGDVARAMVAFREALDNKKPQPELARLALTLAHACRDDLAMSWGTEAWKLHGGS
jgi:hypothetical protein